MPTVWIPALMRNLTEGQESVRVSGATLGDVIEALEQVHPGIKARLVQAQDLRPGLAVVIGTQIVRGGLEQPVADADEIHFIPAIGGG